MSSTVSAAQLIALASFTLAFTSGCASSAQARATMREAEAPVSLSSKATRGGAPSAPPRDYGAEEYAGEAEFLLAGPVSRDLLAEAAIARSPALLAGAKRVRALVATARAESSFEAPELMADIWQVPVSRPWAIGDAQMIMLSISQPLPVPGVRGLREEAGAYEAKAEAKKIAASARALVREVDQAFSDYVEATLQHRARVHYREVVARLVQIAEAKQIAGGPLAESAQAEVELARADIDIAADERAIERARLRINALLSREASAPLGEPVIEAPSVVRLPVHEIVERARTSRPEIEASEARQRAEALSAEAARREASLPAFTVGASYFPPSGMIREHSIGASVGMSLPWLWGAKKHEAIAREERAAAEAIDLRGQRLLLGNDAAAFAQEATQAEQRYVLLSEKALPLSLRAQEAAETAYITGKTDALTWLLAARAVASVQLELVSARVALDRALVDLDFAAGGRLPREPLADFEGVNDAR